MLMLIEAPQPVGYECSFKDFLPATEAINVCEMQKPIYERKGAENLWRVLLSEGKEDHDISSSIDVARGTNWQDSDAVLKVPHDLICSALTGNNLSDMPLSSIRATGSSIDRLTPDIILRMPWGFWVVEVKTSAGGINIQKQRALSSYDGALTGLSRGVNIKFSIVIVTNTSVWSDIPFNQLQTDTLVGLFRAGRQIQANFYELGWRDPKAEVPDVKWSSIWSQIGFREVGSSPYNITEQDTKNWKDTCDISRHFVDSYMSAGELKMTPEPNPQMGDMEYRHVLKWPFIVPAELPSPFSSNSEIPEVALWSAVFSVAHNVYLHEPRYAGIMDKKDRFRVKPQVSDGIWNALAKIGVQGKKHDKWREMVKPKKNPLSETSDTSPIDLWQSQFPDLMTDGNAIECPLVDETRDTNSIEQTRFFEKFLGSTLGSHLKLWQTIAEEVNYSRKQNCKKDTFVLKKLNNVWLLLKPTKAANHIFCSIFYKEELKVGGFRSGIKVQGGYVSRFFTLNPSKLKNHLCCVSTAVSLLGCWNHLFSGKSTVLTRRSMSHASMSLLFFLENKLGASADSLLSRYFYMESMTNQQDIWKVWSKMQDRPMSSLQIHYRKGLRRAGHATSSSDDLMSRLVSWVDGMPFTNLEQCLNTMYIGSTYNKDQGDKIHGFLKIFNKVIKEEAKLDGKTEEQREQCMGHACGTESHEFCPSLLIAMGKKVKARIEKMGEKLFWDETQRSLSKVQWDYFATMKASAVLPPSDHFIPLAKEKSNFRRKCLAAIEEIMAEFPGQAPFECLPVLIKQVEDSGLNIVNLFRKPQHGGDREIFVLHIKFRIVVFFLERIMRSLAEKLPGEMLTKPKEKMAIAARHFGHLMSVADETDSATGITSGDAATWCQRFMMSEFGIFFKQFFPSEIFPMTVRILNLVTNKRLMLPLDLLRTFSKHPTVDSFSPEMNMLKDNFLRGGTLLEEGGVFLRNWSNMMQGILHYTSTAVHWAYRETFKAMLGHFLPAIQTALSVRDLRYSFKVSSDDWSEHLSLTFECLSQRDKVIATSVIERLLKTSGVLFSYAGCLRSVVKTTEAVTKFMKEEFNSKWADGASTLSVLLKFVLRALEPNSMDSLESRLIGYSDSRAQLLSEGATFDLISLVQICQNYQHYRNLGIQDMDERLSAIRYLAHPRYGSFVPEPPSVVGLMGHQYAFYKRLSSHELCNKHEAYLWSNQLIVSHDSSLGSNLHFLYGNHKRYSGFLEEMKVSIDDLRAKYNENHRSLFSLDPEQVSRQRIDLTLLSGSLSSHFKESTLTDMHASSVYLWDEQVFSDGIKKMSLTQALQEARISAEPISMRDKFPLLSTYEELDALLSMPKMTAPKVNFKQRMLKATFSSVGPTLSLLQTARWHWYKEGPLVEEPLVYDALAFYTARHPWFRETAEETMAAVGAKDFVQLRFIIDSLSDVSRNLLVLSTGKQKTSPLLTLREVILSNHNGREILVLLEEENNYHPESGNLTLSKLKSHLAMASAGPNPGKDMLAIMEKNKKVFDTLDVDNLSNKQTSLFLKLLRSLVEGKGEINKDAIDLMLMRDGFLGGFQKRQVYKEGKYWGKGEYLMEFSDKEQITLVMVDDKLLEVRTTSKTALMVHHEAVKRAVFDLGCNIPDQQFIGDAWSRKGITSRGVEIVTTTSQFLLDRGEFSVRMNASGRIRVDCKSDKRLVTVASCACPIDLMVYKPLENDICLSLSNLSSAWMQGSALTTAGAAQLILGSEEDERTWIREHLKHLALSRGYLSLYDSLEGKRGLSIPSTVVLTKDESVVLNERIRTMDTTNMMAQLGIQEASEPGSEESDDSSQGSKTNLTSQTRWDAFLDEDESEEEKEESFGDMIKRLSLIMAEEKHDEKKVVGDASDARLFKEIAEEKVVVQADWQRRIWELNNTFTAYIIFIGNLLTPLINAIETIGRHALFALLNSDASELKAWMLIFPKGLID